MTTNLKSINNQKCQKIKLHGTLTTKELKKQSTRTTRLVRRWTERTHSEAKRVRPAQKNHGKVADHAGRAGFGEAVGCMGGADLRGN